MYVNPASEQQWSIYGTIYCSGLANSHLPGFIVGLGSGQETEHLPSALSVVLATSFRMRFAEGHRLPRYPSDADEELVTLVAMEGVIKVDPRGDLALSRTAMVSPE
jgi:hypothetical protein